MTGPIPTEVQPYVWQRTSVFAVVVLAVVGASRIATGPVWVALALAGIAVAIWHGAFDGVLAQEVLQPRFGSRWRPFFHTAYLALAGVVALLWWRAPLVALVAFLLYSALHFGMEMERERSIPAVLLGTAVGFLPIAAACRWWPAQVSAIFAVMLRPSAASALPLAVLCGRVLWPLVFLILVGNLLKRPRRIASVLAFTLAALLLLRCCSPVVAFAIYFCAWHTPEHLLGTSLDEAGHFQTGRMWSHLRQSFALWVVSLVGIALLCWWGRDTLAGYAGAVFIALSALTVPHMALAECLRRLQRSTTVPAQLLWIGPKAVHR